MSTERGPMGEQPDIYKLPEIADPYIDPDYKQRSLVKSLSNRLVVREYLRSHPELTPGNRAAIPSWTNGPTYNPNATIGVPYDIDDDPVMLLDTLCQMDNKRKHNRLQVVVGVNAEAQGSESDRARNLSKFEDLTELLAATHPDPSLGLSLKALYASIEARNMNKVWNWLVHVAVADDIRFRDASYPVVRMDTDSTGLSDWAITEMIDAVRSNIAHLVKMPTSFDPYGLLNHFERYQMPQYLNATERSAYTITHVYAVAKDMIDAQLGANEHRTYNEESGSGAQLVNWMRVLTCQRYEDPHQISDEGENKAFLRIAKLALRDEVAPIAYLDRRVALHHTSYRRIFLNALRMPAWQIPISEDGADYQSYVQMRDTAGSVSESQEHTLEDVMAMVGIIFLRQEKVSGRTLHLPQYQQSQLALFIDAQFSRHDKQLYYTWDWLSEAKHLGAIYLSRDAL